MKQLLASDSGGAAAIEYALAAALIALAIVGSVAALGERVEGSFENANAALPGSGTDFEGAG